jgi:hypothetical protein
MAAAALASSQEHGDEAIPVHRVSEDGHRCIAPQLAMMIRFINGAPVPAPHSGALSL